MKKNWTGLYKTLSSYRKEYLPEEKIIKDRYENLIQSLKDKEKEELENLSNKVNNEVNKDNYDLEVNPYTLYYALGAEIGKKIKIKLKDTDNEKYKENNENGVFDSFFEYTCVDRREGIHYFVSEDQSLIIFPTDIIEYFDFEVIEAFEKQIEIPLQNIKK